MARKNFSKILLSALILLVFIAPYIGVGQNTPIAGARVTVLGDNGYAEVETGPDGVFTIEEGLGTGSYVVYVGAKGFISKELRGIKVEANKVTDLGDIVLEPSGIVRGRVVDPNGRAVGNIPVMIERNGRVLETVYTDNSGNFEFSTNLETGTYTIRALPFMFKGFEIREIPIGFRKARLPFPVGGEVFAQGYTVGVKSGVSVTQGEVTENIVVELGLSGIISGRVVDEDGEPVEGVLVAAWSTRPGEEFNGFYALTNSNGEYRIANNLATGTYNVSLVFPRGYVWSFREAIQVEVKAGEEVKNVDFVVKKSGKISGIVVYSNGLPAPNVTVVAASQDGEYFGITYTNVDGTFTIDSGLGTAKYIVTAFSAANYAKPVQVSVEAGKEVGGVRLVLQGTGAVKAVIKGVVRDEEGNPIYLAEVESYGTTTYTGRDGKYSLVVTLPSGEKTDVVVSVFARGYKPQNKTVTVGAGETIGGVDFTLKRLPSGILKGRVLGARVGVGKENAALSIGLSKTTAVVGETVTVSGSLSPPRAGKVSILVSKDGGEFVKVGEVDLVDGRYSLEYRPTEAGRYVFKATWPGDEEYNPAESTEVVLEVTIGKVTPTVSLSVSKTTARVGDTITVSGSIEPFKGDTEVIIIVSGPKGKEEHVVSSTDGKFSYTFKVDAEGTWSIQARVPAGAVYNEATSTVVTVSVSAAEEKKCVIATATFGSEVAPEVDFLRGFRDNLILSTYTGSSFYIAFDAFYYSWSTPVAKLIENNEFLRSLAKILIYPLLGILLLTAFLVTPIFSLAPEAAAVIAGFIASSLIGIVYLTPLVVLIYLVSRRRGVKLGGEKNAVRVALLLVSTSLILIVVGYVAKHTLLTTIATSTYVLSTMSLASIAAFTLIRRKLGFK